MRERPVLAQHRLLGSYRSGNVTEDSGSLIRAHASLKCRLLEVADAA